MTAFTDYAEKAILDHVLGVAAYTQPSGLVVALYTTVPGEDGTGGTEITGSGYSRQAITFNAATLGAGTATNSSAHSWTNGSGGDWIVNGAAIFDTEGTPNMLLRGTIVGAPKTVNDGDIFTISAGQMTFTLG